MTRSLLTKLSIAAAATMLTLSPALAGSGYNSHGYSHGKYSKYDYKRHNHFHGKRPWYRTHRHWKPRFYAWKYGHKHYRRW
jgi:hypothetical protein